MNIIQKKYYLDVREVLGYGTVLSSTVTEENLIIELIKVVRKQKVRLENLEETLESSIRDF
jgi:hypothetical protein